jgi:parallel beta-helix repeat protein
MIFLRLNNVGLGERKLLKKTVSGMMLTLLMLSMLTLAINIQPVKASGTIYIRADGSVDPPTAPIQRNGNIYTIIGNIVSDADGIVIQRSNIIMNGNGYTLQGPGAVDTKGFGVSDVNNVTIQNVNIKRFCYGIYLYHSSTNIILGNNITNNRDYGVFVDQSSCNNTISWSTIKYNTFYGVKICRFSNNNNVSGNNIISNNIWGVLLSASSNNTLKNNNIGWHDYNFGVEASDWNQPTQFIHNVDSSNTVDGKPIYYWINRQNMTVPSNAGYVALVNSANITVEGLELKSNENGMILVNVNNSKIANNKITNNEQGVYLINVNKSKIANNKITNSICGVTLHNSFNNSISGNNVTNTYIGINIRSSSNNFVYHNNLIDNTQQVQSDGSMNIWDDGYPSGGNYWSDYSGVDANGDGIGDIPYVIDSHNQDGHPLMNLWPLPWGDWKHYHNYTEIVDTLLYLNEKYPNITDVFSIGKSWQNRDIYCIRLTNESNTHPKPKLFFVGYHHAREPITVELALYFIVEALTKYGINETFTRMLNYSEIYVVPALNVDGFGSVGLNEWQRKNAHPYDEDGDGLFDEDPPDDTDGDGYIEDLIFNNGTYYQFIRWEGIDDDGDGLCNEDWVGGVDLNRNYQWDTTYAAGSPNPWDETYRGPTSFSEPETQAIRDFALQHNLKYALSFHSGAEYIGCGYSYTNEEHNCTFIEVAENLSILVGAPYYLAGLGGLPSGTFNDWMYGHRSTFAFTCEIYTNNSAWQYEPGPDPDTWWEKGVFQFFNPDPSQIETVIQRWLPVFTYITNRAITEAYDITTTNITPLKTVVGQGFSTQINVTVTNQGDFTETINVTVYANTTIIETKEVTLTSGNSTTVTFTWNTTGFAKGNYTIWAYVWPVPSETDTTDNTHTNGVVTVATVGDIVPDGTVDIYDLVTVAKAYGSTPSDPNWNPNADINNDDIIDIFDLVTVAKHYGQTNP